jgi:hypothetical protein
MWRFSSAAMRASSRSAIGSSVYLPVFRWLTRVASSWNETYASECIIESGWSAAYPCDMWVIRNRSSSTGSTDRLTTR